MIEYVARVNNISATYDSGEAALARWIKGVLITNFVAIPADFIFVFFQEGEFVLDAVEDIIIKAGQFAGLNILDNTM